MRIILTAVILAGLSASAGFGADAKAGKATYTQSCQSCHGADGAGNPAIAKMMNVEMKDLKSPEVQTLSDDDIKKIIAGGKGKMRPVTSVTGAAADNVVAYIRSLKK
jgi:mono/diheme cytochrome c family protein